MRSQASIYVLGIVLGFIAYASSYDLCKSLLEEVKGYNENTERDCKERMECEAIADKIRASCLPTSTNKTKWEAFKKKYKKCYIDATDELLHCISYHNSLHQIYEHNVQYSNKQQKYFMKETEFTDMGAKEFLQKYNSPPLRDDGLSLEFPSITKQYAPESYDLNAAGLVTEARNQKATKGSWAMAAIGVLEVQYAKATGTLVKLSEQEIIDCTFDHPIVLDMHKARKKADAAFLSVKFDGVGKWEDYPSVGFYSKCKNKIPKVVKVDKVYHLEKGIHQAQRFIANFGAIISQFYADPAIRLYGGGLFTGTNGCVGDRFNHAILIVGYDEMPDFSWYWLAKNSLGKDWGENGFIKLPRNRDSCGIEHSFITASIKVL